MRKELIKIKGGADGFLLIVDSSAKLEEVQAELEKKLAENPEFFPEGTEFKLVVADLNKNVKKGISEFLTNKGLNIANSTNTAVQQKEQPKVNVNTQQNQGQQAANSGISQQEMTVVNRTVRNGEQITSNGSVMICGNVNPGASIVAAGSIDIRGTCRGIVHAGAAGDIEAFVVADCLLPTQVRIANLIARSPDNIEKNNFAEKAYIKDGQIVIEPIER